MKSCRVRREDAPVQSDPEGRGLVVIHLRLQRALDFQNLQHTRIFHAPTLSLSAATVNTTEYAVQKYCSTTA